MKTYLPFKSLTLACLLLLSGTVLMAQSKEKDEKAAQEAEMKAKKEMLEQQKQMKEQQQKMRELEIVYADQARSAGREARESSRARTYVRSSGDFPDSYYIYSGNEQSSQSQLTLRNSFDGSSESSKGEFEVAEGTHNFRVMINGKVKSGEIRIIVDYPNGNTFKDMTINSAAEISYSQSMTIKDEEDDKYIGDWSYKVIAENAKGNYMLQIMTH